MVVNKSRIFPAWFTSWSFDFPGFEFAIHDFFFKDVKKRTKSSCDLDDMRRKKWVFLRWPACDTTKKMWGSDVRTNPNFAKNTFSLHFNNSWSFLKSFNSGPFFRSHLPLAFWCVGKYCIYNSEFIPHLKKCNVNKNVWVINYFSIICFEIWNLPCRISCLDDF